MRGEELSLRPSFRRRLCCMSDQASDKALGVQVGTVNYMAPEAFAVDANGDPVTVRCLKRMQHNPLCIAFAIAISHSWLSGLRFVSLPSAQEPGDATHARCGADDARSQPEKAAHFAGSVSPLTG